jgi:hypothetical protein
MVVRQLFEGEYYQLQDKDFVELLMQENIFLEDYKKNVSISRKCPRGFKMFKVILKYSHLPLK